MDVYVSVGEWMNSLNRRMDNARDGDCFHLPTPMHFHAYELLKKERFPEKKFRVEVK